MASEVGSTLVLFIAAVGLAGVVGAGLASSLGDVALSMNRQGEVLADAIRTDVAIVNDPDNVPYDDANDELTIYVKNTGSRTLTENDLVILVDGTHESFNGSVVEEDRWSQGTVLEATVDVNLASGDHTVRALYTPNIADQLDFRV